jgi:hypothetical protein
MSDAQYAFELDSNAPEPVRKNILMATLEESLPDDVHEIEAGDWDRYEIEIIENDGVVEVETQKLYS